MITLLRKIRRKLVTENSFNKYLLYAIGEIILVVIGILIALQINDWNDQKKQATLEVKILKEIQNNLGFDLVEIREDLSVMDSIDVAIKYVVKSIEKHDKPTDKFKHHALKLRGAPHFNPNKSGYELLMSKGVDIITNDSLRMDISSMYESTYPYYNQYENERIEFKTNFIQPELIKSFKWSLDDTKYFFATAKISHEDYKTIKENGSFLKLAHAVEYENWLVHNRAERIEQNIINLIDFIGEEIKEKDNSF